MDLSAFPPFATSVVDRLLARCAADRRFVGVVLGGSAARGQADEHSDLDLVLVCRDEDHAELLAATPLLAEDLGPLLASFTGEHVGEPRLLIALYGPPLLHVDLKLVARRDAGSRVEDGLILWERDGAITAARAHVDAAWPMPSPQWIEDRFWVWVHYGATKIARGELFECLDLLAMLRGVVLGPLVAVRAGSRPQGVRRVEAIAPEVVPALAATLGAHDRAACATALQAAVTLYRELRDDLAEEGLVRRDDAEREARGLLAHEDGATPA